MYDRNGREVINEIYPLGSEANQRAHQNMTQARFILAILTIGFLSFCAVLAKFGVIAQSKPPAAQVEQFEK